MNALATAAGSAAAFVLASCVSASGGARRVEVLAAVRNPDDRLGGGDESHNVFGASAVIEDAELENVAADIGVRVADFESDEDRGSWFLELHVGARYYLLSRRSPLRPFVGAGIMGAFGEHTEYFEDKDGKSLYEDPEEGPWLPAGLYGCVGLDLALDPLVLSVAARAALADGIDPFARDPNDVAVDVVAAVGWRF